MVNLRKGLSLGGAGWQYESVYTTDPNAYTQNDFRQPNILSIFDYGRPQPSKWVKLWINMRQLFEGTSYVPPAPDPNDATAYKSMWNFLTYDAHCANTFANLDAQIKAANDRGCAVILTMYQELPRWATYDYVNGPVNSYPDVNANPSRWGWFIGYLYARYRKDVGPNSPGPNDSNQYGNPFGASLYGIEPLNEPNQLLGPNYNANGDPGYNCFVPKAMMFADLCSAFWAGSAGPYTFGPAVGDITNKYPRDTYGRDVRSIGAGQVDYQDFTVAVMNMLRNWTPYRYVGWSIHNYRDVKYYDDTTAQPMNQSSRFAVLAMQQQAWKNGTDLNVYITEAGLDLTNINGPDARNGYPAQVQNGPGSPSAYPGVDGTYRHTDAGMKRQFFAVVNNYTRVLNDGYAFCYLNHSANDGHEVNFQSGLRGLYGDAGVEKGQDRYILSSFLTYTANPGAY